MIKKLKCFLINLTAFCEKLLKSKFITIQNILRVEKLVALLFILTAHLLMAQTPIESENSSTNINNQIFLSLSSANNSLYSSDFNNNRSMSLAIDYNKFNLQQKLIEARDSID